MRRWSGIAGIVFVVLAIVSRAVQGSRPDPTKRDALSRFTAFYTDKSHNTHALVAVVLGFIGLFAFSWFLGGIWSLLRQAEGATTVPLIVVVVGGAAFVSLGMVFHVFAEGVGVTLHFGKGYTIDKGFDPGTALLMSSLAQGAFLGSMLAVGAATAAAGVVIVRTRALPVWLAWIGIAIAVLCLPTIPPLTFIAAVLLAVWTLVTSGLMMRRDMRPAPIASSA
jgi:hypothetical protein